MLLPYPTECLQSGVRSMSVFQIKLAYLDHDPAVRFYAWHDKDGNPVGLNGRVTTFERAHLLYGPGFRFIDVINGARPAIVDEWFRESDERYTSKSKDGAFPCRRNNVTMVRDVLAQAGLLKQNYLETHFRTLIRFVNGDNMDFRLENMLPIRVFKMEFRERKSK